jgi:hypothetical protein
MKLCPGLKRAFVVMIISFHRYPTFYLSKVRYNKHFVTVTYSRELLQDICSFDKPAIG